MGQEIFAIVAHLEPPSEAAICARIQRHAVFVPLHCLLPKSYMDMAGKLFTFAASLWLG